MNAPAPVLTLGRLSCWCFNGHLGKHACGDKRVWTTTAASAHVNAPCHHEKGRKLSSTPSDKYPPFATLKDRGKVLHLNVCCRAALLVSVGSLWRVGHVLKRRTMSTRHKAAATSQKFNPEYRWIGRKQHLLQYKLNMSGILFIRHFCPVAATWTHLVGEWRRLQKMCHSHVVLREN